MAAVVQYQGRRIDLILETIPLPDGGSLVKEIVRHPGAAVILPLTNDGRVVMIRNHRWSIDRELLELPAGTLDPGEDPETCARRELEEETGYRAGRWRKLIAFYPSPGILTERMHLFTAEELQPGAMRLDPGERLQPVLIPWAEALRMAIDGTIIDGKTLIGVLLWDRLKS